MTQLHKDPAERAGPTSSSRKGDKKRLAEGESREMENEADIALREAHEKAEVERVPGGKSAGAAAGRASRSKIDE